MEGLWINYARELHYPGPALYSGKMAEQHAKAEIPAGTNTVRDTNRHRTPTHRNNCFSR
jgi:hypothetical protein